MSRVLLIPDMGQDAEFRASLRLADESQAPSPQHLGSQAILESRSNQLGKQLDRLEKPVRIIAHGFGCLVAVAATTGKSYAIQGALLVPSVFIARPKDPSMSMERARQWSRRWGSRLIHVGEGDPQITTTGFYSRLTYRESKSHWQGIEPQNSGNERCWRVFAQPSEYRLNPG